MRERNVGVPEDKQILYRIGINIGDIIVDGEDIYGDGVNIAARLQGLAEPGGISIAQNVYNQIKGKLNVELEHLGEQQVKNIADPVTAYRVVLNTKATALVTPLVHVPVKKWRVRLWHAAAAFAITVVAGGAIAWWQPWATISERASIERMAFPLPDKPSIAVLPFNNFSTDPEQGYFADGMTEDLITDLSKVSGIFVIARNSSWTYKDKPTKVQQVAEELGVRYVLEGSVRREGDQVRINAQLVDALTGHHLWAERYDGSAGDVFSLQDKVIRQIVEALAVNLTTDESRQVGAAETAVPQAYGWDGWAATTSGSGSRCRCRSCSLTWFPESGRTSWGCGRSTRGSGSAASAGWLSSRLGSLSPADTGRYEQSHRVLQEGDRARSGLRPSLCGACGGALENRQRALATGGRGRMAALV